MLERIWFRGWKRPENPQRMSRLQLIAGKVGSKFIEASAAPILKQFTYWHLPQNEEQQRALEKGAALINEAFGFIREKHAGQVRKKTGEPYEVHPFHVGYWAARAGCPLPVVLAGLLHDTVEDCGVRLEEIEASFGKDCAYLVRNLSAPKRRARLEVREKERSGDYLEKMLHSPGDLDHIVYPHQEEYHLPESEDDKAWKDNVKALDLLAALYREQLFKPNKALNELDRYAILLKAFDFAHSQMRSQIRGVPEARKAAAKATVVGIARFLSRINPLFENSTRYFTKEFGRAWKRQEPVRKWGWATELAPIDDYEFFNYLKMPPSDVPTIRVHRKAGGTEAEAYFPFALFSHDKQTGEAIVAELAARANRHSDDARIRLGADIRPPGLTQFHVANVTLNRKFPFNQLMQELRHVYLRHAERPFERDASNDAYGPLKLVYDHTIPVHSRTFSVYAPAGVARPAEFKARLEEAGFQEVEVERVRKGSQVLAARAAMPEGLPSHKHAKFLRENMNAVASAFPGKKGRRTASRQRP